MSEERGGWSSGADRLALASPSPPCMAEEVFGYYRDRQAHTEQQAQDAMQQEAALDEVEETHDPARVCWQNLNGNDERCEIITGFTCEQFLQLYEACEAAIPEVIGRGRRSRVSKHDRLLLVLCYVKHYETKEKLAQTFLVSKSQVQRQLDETIAAITPLLYACYVESIYVVIGPDPEPEEFPYARYVMDATFQETWTPLGTYAERKRFYSGKHKAYGLKTQTLHNRRGFVLHCISGIPGAVHDLTIARQNIEQARAPSPP
jgi:hypothetical protein